MDATMLEAIDHCQRSVDAAQVFIDSVGESDLGRPTPCAHWDVRSLLEHMIWMGQVFTGGLTGGEIPDEPAPLGDDPAGDYAATSAVAMAAWRGVDWSAMTLRLPFSELPAAIGVRVFIGDNSIHTWDLATALGRPFVIDEVLAGPQLDLMQQFYDPTNRGPQASFDLAAPCPSGASITERLIALSGRQLPR
jgi:uncharacterized protein (TIGR03086 family)